MFISKIRIPCTIVASPIYFSTPITDVAEVLFNMCITPDEKTMKITYNYELLEHYSAQTATSAQTSGSVAQTSGSVAQTSGSVAQTSGSAAQSSGSVATNAQTSGSVATNAQSSGYTAQTSGSTATNATTQTVATSSFITPGATNPLAVSVSTPTLQTTCPSWLSHMDQKKLEKKDDIPNHPLVLMVNMQAVPHNNIVSLGQCHVTFPVYCKSISMCLYHGSVPCT